MKRNVVIVLLSAALIFQFARHLWKISTLMVAARDVRIAGYEVWNRACTHAAAGDSRRSNWCKWAYEQTSWSAAQEGISEEMIRAFTLDSVARKPKAARKHEIKW